MSERQLAKLTGALAIMTTVAILLLAVSCSN